MDYHDIQGITEKTGTNSEKKKVLKRFLWKKIINKSCEMSFYNQ